MTIDNFCDPQRIREGSKRRQVLSSPRRLRRQQQRRHRPDDALQDGEAGTLHLAPRLRATQPVDRVPVGRHPCGRPLRHPGLGLRDAALLQAPGRAGGTLAGIR